MKSFHFDLTVNLDNKRETVLKSDSERSQGLAEFTLFSGWKDGNRSQTLRRYGNDTRKAFDLLNK